MEKPFHQLKAGKWLHGRTETDVFKLLIDSYRLRMEDDYNITGDVDEDSLYGGAANSVRPFQRFLTLTRQRPGLLPEWWTDDSARKCVKYGRESKNWSGLSYAVEKHDLIEHYGHPTMPMQLRMFAEQVYGTGPGGQNGEAMLDLQVGAERAGGFQSVMSLG